MIAYSAAHWTEFGVATAGAAAALAGLLVVAISINLQRIIDNPTLPHRAAATLILFTLPLITGLLLVAPGQPRAALAWELLVLGVIVGTFLEVTDFRLPLAEQETRLTWLGVRIVPEFVTCGGLAVAGATLLAQGGGGLYWTVPAVITSFVFGLINTWVLLIEILR